MKKEMKLAVKFKITLGKIQLFDKNGSKLPGKGSHWGGNFYCSSNQLTSLECAPESVGGDFYCHNNQLTSLEGAPESVGGAFYCDNNQLTSLEGAPESVGGAFYCYNNHLTSLEGAPESVGGTFHCSNNQLTSLEGAPESVGGNFSCYNNQLTSLEGAPESVGGNFYCYNNQLTSLEGAPESVGGDFHCDNNRLTSLEGAPESNSNMFDSFYKNKFVFADRILTKLLSRKKEAGVIIYKTQRLGKKEVVYIATKDNKTFAHGKSVREAVMELEFKSGKRDISEYKNMPPDTIKPPHEWAFIYRMITGACQAGVSMFMDRHKLKERYTLAEIIEATKGQFGNDRLQQVTRGK